VDASALGPFWTLFRETMGRVSLLAVVAVAFFCAWRFTRALCGPRAPLRLLDHPNERSLHQLPTPRTGGVAIIGAVGAGLLIDWGVAVLLDRSPIVRDWSIAWIVGVTLGVAAVSFWDDRTGLPAALRLVVHVLAAAALVGRVGLVVERVPIPLVGTLELAWAAAPVTLLLVVWMTNLYNFMDGMDGFAGGMTVSGFACLAFLAWRANQYPLAALALVVVAAAGGFLVHNIPPARIFMGDVGSVSLGFLAGSLSAKAVHDKLFDVWVPALIFAPFVVDATVTLLRRLVAGERVWEPHRTHWYQRAVLAGLGHRKTVLSEFALMVAGGLTAVAYVELAEPRWRALLLLGWAAIWAVLAHGVRLLETRGPARRTREGR
jgi:UDP-N-acetylmuramyl pentapeptide phosphotransferase/UDP-N-acetylglucosamine-1-phosphate transferase